MRNKFLKALLFGAALVGVMVMTSGSALAAVRLVNVVAQSSGAICTYSDQRQITFNALMPKGIHFAAENGKDISNENLRLEGGETRYLQVMVSDSNGNSELGDAGDFQTYTYSANYTVSADIVVLWDDIPDVKSTDVSVATPDLAYASLPADYRQQLDEGFAASVQRLRDSARSGYGYWARLTTGGTTGAISATVENEDLEWIRDQIPAGHNSLATVKVTGVQQAGTQSTAFDPQHATISYRLSFAASQPDDTELWPTAFINVTVFARDMGSDDGDNGGGSCGMGLGGASLLFACLALLRKRR